VPIPTGSIITLTALVKKPATKENINWLFSEVSKYHMKGVLEYTEEPIVSTDIVHNPHSCIFDAGLTKVTDGNLVSVTGWYDNEWGYSNRMIDVLKMMR
jgi:glyceraldehyde 3-phosphate dehydrogenase